MKYSLRSLMAVPIMGPAALAGCYFGINLLLNLPPALETPGDNASDAVFTVEGGESTQQHMMIFVNASRNARFAFKVSKMVLEEPAGVTALQRSPDSIKIEAHRIGEARLIVWK